jgi:tRNA nucleotidyltransferase (CCA-adding enzyme)
MTMRAYIVGGAVRDALLGRPVKDRDWVVVGETPEAMIARGYRPVGRDFPVFLHPETHEEYALARTERKSGHGYAGFVCRAAPDVTLEDDLLRRDLTINAIARAADGTLIDPHGGIRDLEARIFRHVSPAFAEDPLRILRLARFAARYADFTLAPETLGLTRQMVNSGELDYLVAERVWQELARGLMEAQPSRMLDVMRACGALAVILPEIGRLFDPAHGPSPALPPSPATGSGARLLRVIDRAASAGLPLAARWAVLLRDLGAALATNVSQRLKTPASCREFAAMLAREHGILGKIDGLDAEAIVETLERCDVSRRSERFLALLDAAGCDDPAPDGDPRAAWLAALSAFSSIDAAALARACRERQYIPARIHAARVAAVAARMKSRASPLAPSEHPDETCRR